MIALHLSFPSNPHGRKYLSDQLSQRQATGTLICPFDRMMDFSFSKITVIWPGYVEFLRNLLFGWLTQVSTLDRCTSFFKGKTRQMHKRTPCVVYLKGCVGSTILCRSFGSDQEWSFHKLPCSQREGFRKMIRSWGAIIKCDSRRWDLIRKYTSLGTWPTKLLPPSQFLLSVSASWLPWCEQLTSAWGW